MGGINCTNNNKSDKYTDVNWKYWTMMGKIWVNGVESRWRRLVRGVGLLEDALRKITPEQSAY